MTEYILDIYSEGVTRRFSLPKKEYDEILRCYKDEQFFDYSWDMIDAAGAYIVLDFTKITGCRFYKREVKNPMELDEHYENPLS